MRWQTIKMKLFWGNTLMFTTNRTKNKTTLPRVARRTRSYWVQESRNCRQSRTLWTRKWGISTLQSAADHSLKLPWMHRVNLSQVQRESLLVQLKTSDLSLTQRLAVDFSRLGHPFRVISVSKCYQQQRVKAISKLFKYHLLGKPRILIQAPTWPQRCKLSPLPSQTTAWPVPIRTHSQTARKPPSRDQCRRLLNGRQRPLRALPKEDSIQSGSPYSKPAWAIPRNEGDEVQNTEKLEDLISPLIP